VCFHNQTPETQQLHCARWYSSVSTAVQYNSGATPLGLVKMTSAAIADNGPNCIFQMHELFYTSNTGQHNSGKFVKLTIKFRNMPKLPVNYKFQVSFLTIEICSDGGIVSYQEICSDVLLTLGRGALCVLVSVG
jgi:hypothetical protein